MEGSDLRQHGSVHDALRDLVDADQGRVADGIEYGVSDLRAPILKYTAAG